MDLLKDLQRDTGMGLILITHDLGVVNEVADRVAVMYAGRIVETRHGRRRLHQPGASLHRRPDELDPAGRGQGRPAQADRRASRRTWPRSPAGCPFHPRCPLARTGADGRAGSRLRRPTCRRCAWSPPAARRPATTPRRSSMPEAPLTVQAGGTTRPGWRAGDAAARDQRPAEATSRSPRASSSRRRSATSAPSTAWTSTLRRGETLGLVGESGCGKSTVAKLLVALEKPTGGTIRYKGEDVAKMGGRALKRYRREVQIIFQDPYGSLNPRMTVGDIVAEGWSVHADIAPAQGPAAAHPGAARAGRPEPRLRQPLPAPVLRRPAPAHRHRPGARAAAGGHRLRRAGVGARRVGAGPGGQPARGPAGRASGCPTSSSPTTCRWCATSPTGSR